MATPAKLTPLQESEARRLAEQAARANKVTKVYSDEEKAARKERVARAKDAMSRSVGLKGAHVAPARAALKSFLQRLNEPNQPDDAHFEMLVEAPFKAPPEEEDQRPSLLTVVKSGGRGAPSSPVRSPSLRRSG